MSLVVDGLAVETAGGLRLLEGIGFVVPAGTMLAVAGPTGAGKTTLAQALTGALPVATGEIRVAGRDVTALDASRRGIGYVPQSDALHPELSVRRTLDYAAALRMSDQDGADRRRRIERVLDETRLSGQAELTVAALSVGQRKRLSIAIELLSMPAVLVLDEPTSSLDPGYEESVLSTLRGLAELGHAVVVVTHSQTAIASCDRVVLLSSGGRLAYFGAPSRMHEHFDTTTAGELFSALDVVVPATQAAHPSMGRRTTVRASEQPRSVEGRAAWRQLPILTRRYVDLIFADRRRTWLFALQGVVLGVLLLAFVEPHGLARPVHDPTHTAPLSATGMAVLLVMCMTWLGTSNSVREIVKERHILVREHRSGLSSVAYVASKVAVLGPLLAAEAAVVTLLAVRRERLPHTGAVLPSGTVELVVGLALAGLCAVTLGLFVSAVVRSNDKALAVLPMVVVVEFVLSGLTPSVSWLGLGQIRDLAATHWAVQAVEATVTGDSHSWWVAVGALLGLSAAALAGTLLAVRRSLRLPVARSARTPVVHRIRNASHGFNPEMVRLSRVGASCMVGVAIIVAVARVVAPADAEPSAPVIAAAPVATSQSVMDTVGAQLPGLLGDFWWMWRAGTTVGIDATEAAYVRSSLS